MARHILAVTGLLLFLIADFCHSACAAGNKRIVQLKVVGPPETVWKYTGECKYVGLEQKPPTPAVPDSPPRVIRLAGGRLSVFAVNRINLPMISNSTLSKFTISSCKPMLRSPGNADPATFKNFIWALDPFTRNGKQVYVLAHNEFHGSLYREKCRSGGNHDDPFDTRCFYAGLTSWFADASDLSLRPASHVPFVAAAIQYRFSSDMNIVGVQQPTNIFLNPEDGQYYFFAVVSKYRRQPGGGWAECLFRNADPFSRRWYAWTGKDGWQGMGSPYKNEANRSRKICQPVLHWHMSEVVYDVDAKTFIGVGECPEGICYAVSPDVTGLNRPKVLYKTQNFDSWWQKRTMKNPVGYVSILDPNSKSRNFDTIAGSPWLYYVKFMLRFGRPSGAREIDRIPLSVSRK